MGMHELFIYCMIKTQPAAKELWRNTLAPINLLPKLRPKLALNRHYLYLICRKYKQMLKAIEMRKH